MVNCCHCRTQVRAAANDPDPGIRCWGDKVEMKFPLTHSYSLRVRGRPSPLQAASQQSQLLRFHPLGPCWSKYCILCHTKIHKSCKQVTWPSSQMVQHLALSCTSLQNGIGSVKHQFSFVNLCWFLLTTFLSFMSLEIISRISWGEAGWPVARHIFLRTGVVLSFFESWGTAPSCHDSWHT